MLVQEELDCVIIDDIGFIQTCVYQCEMQESQKNQ